MTSTPTWVVRVQAAPLADDPVRLAVLVVCLAEKKSRHAQVADQARHPGLADDLNPPCRPLDALDRHHAPVACLDRVQVANRARVVGFLAQG